MACPPTSRWAERRPCIRRRRARSARRRMRHRRSSAPKFYVLAALTSAGLFAQDLEIVPVRGNIYMLSGAGSNITVSTAKDGVFLVDSGTAQMSDKVLSAIQRLSLELTKVGKPILNESRSGSGTTLTGIARPQPIRYIANTSALPDHAGGNPRLA